jgi:uncharacterized BrkB/YihY/UPF0761 family membrane protein
MIPSVEELATPPDDDVATEARGLHALAGAARGRAEGMRLRADDLLTRHRDRPLVDLALRFHLRDREAAGTVVSSAVALRLFLFFVPMLLFVVGIVGFFGGVVSSSDVDSAGVTGSLARQIDTALNQPTSTRWIATLVGLFGMLTTGRSLARVLAQASCLAWRLPLSSKAPVRLIGTVVGLLVGLGVSAALVNVINDRFGVGAAGLSFLAVLSIYVVGALVLAWQLPRAAADPGVLLPGALLLGLTFAGLQAYSQLFLPGQFSRASELYGSIGLAIVTLGWFFIAGRVIVMAMVLDAVVYERFGTVSRFVFSLPLLRAIPRRSPWIARRFGLTDEEADA